MNCTSLKVNPRLLTNFPLCNQNGTALLITLLVVSILTGLAVDFAYEVYIGTSSLSNWSNAQKASLTAKSGQALASNLLKEIKELPPTSQSEVILPIEKSFGENTTLTVKLEDEEAKFNINSIIFPESGRKNDFAFNSLQKLIEYLNINPNIAQNIADWIGTEKKAYLWSVEELKFIKGIDKETFDKISPFLTVYGDRFYYKTNINTAKLPVLVSLGISETKAKEIIGYRESTPFENTGSLFNAISGLDTVIGNKITVRSSNFKVTSTATVNEITRTIESVTDTSMNIHYWREG
jgi:type II secretory pathway component PulK